MFLVVARLGPNAKGGNSYRLSVGKCSVPPIHHGSCGAWRNAPSRTRRSTFFMRSLASSSSEVAAMPCGNRIAGAHSHPRHTQGRHSFVPVNLKASRLGDDNSNANCLVWAPRGSNLRTGHFPRHHSHPHPDPGRHHHAPITSSVLVVGIACRLPNGAVQGAGVAHSLSSCGAFIFVSALLLRP